MRMLAWLMGLAGAITAPMVWAVPFTVELTIPDAHGGIFPGPDLPNTFFTAPHIVMRATGDTANVIYRSADGSTRYQASTLVIEIPGVGRGLVAGSDVAVSAGSTTLYIDIPAFPSFFNTGASATYPEIAGYDLQHSIGPIALDDAHTYHYGPAGSVIPFTLEADGRPGTVAAGRVPGATLRITVGGLAPNPLAARPYTDLAEFLAATGPNGVATFEEGSSSSSGGVTFPEGLLKVAESVDVVQTGGPVAKPHAYWFGTSGTASHFAINPETTSSNSATRFEAAFAEPVLAAGFLFNCYNCHFTPLQYGMVWTTRDVDGTTIERGTTVVDLTLPAGSQQPGPGFFGLTTTRPFRRLTIEKFSPFGFAQPWMIDDLRYATALPAIEYRHAGFDHYFVTSIADELTKLDDGTFAGWARTGLQFSVTAPGAAATRPVCRLFSTAFGARSSHFYSSDAAECELRKHDPAWQFEGTVFGLPLPDIAGRCAGGTVPLFRLYNNGQGGAPNHRYTTSAAARQAMVDAGWISEGAGALGEIGCVFP